MNTIMQVLTKLEKIEQALGEIYLGFATRLGRDSELGRFFWKLHQEEETHAGHVSYQKRLIRQNPNQFDKINVNLEELDEVLHYLTHLLENPPQVTEKQALLLALDLETLSQEKMYRSLIVESCPELKPLIENLTRFDADHADAVKEMAGSYGVTLPL